MFRLQAKAGSIGYWNLNFYYNVNQGGWKFFFFLQIQSKQCELKTKIELQIISCNDRYLPPRGIRSILVIGQYRLFLVRTISAIIITLNYIIKHPLNAGSTTVLLQSKTKQILLHVFFCWPKSPKLKIIKHLFTIRYQGH